MVIFSTNLEPEQLMDPAFLRRLPYKIEVGAPSLERYRRIFEQECRRQGMSLQEDVFATIVYKLKKEKGLDFAAYQPRFIVEQVVATCRFLGEQPHFEPRFIDYAMDNLRVRHHSPGE
jgi:SpoVK/Ycf46/Vps4 family AAA+-type ATPase